MNFFEGQARGGRVTVPALGGAEIDGPARLTSDGPVTVGLRPNQLHLAAGESHGVDLSEQLGGVSYHYLTAPDGARIIVEAHDQAAPKPGSRTGLSFDAADALFFDAETEARLR
jgi:lactose/L-arabinose transport system ATP-binding protein